VINQVKLTKPDQKAGPALKLVQRDKLKTDPGGHGQKINKQLLCIKHRIGARDWLIRAGLRADKTVSSRSANSNWLRPLERLTTAQFPHTCKVMIRDQSSLIGRNIRQIVSL